MNGPGGRVFNYRVRVGLAFALVHVLGRAVSGQAPAELSRIATTTSEMGSLLQSCSRMLDPRPVLRIKSPETDVGMFLKVSGGLLLPDGSIAITSSGTHSVLMFGRNGRLKQTFGRRGEGPSEFRSVSGMWRVNDSTLMVANPRKTQVIFLDSRKMSSPRTVQLQLAKGVRWPAVVGYTNQSIVAINGQIFENGQMGIGVVRPPFVFLRFALNGTLRDTLVTMPGTEFFVPSDHRTKLTQAVPFGTTVLFAASPSRGFLNETSGGRIESVLSDDRIRTLAQIPVTRRPITRADIARYKAERLNAATNEAQRRMVTLLDHVPFPKAFPATDRMFASAEGDMWIRHHMFGTASAHEWTTMSSTGGPTCSVRVPSGLRLLDVAGNRVLAISSDDDGIEEIQVFQFSQARTSR